MRRNAHPGAERAVEKYREFHRYDPKAIRISRSFEVPDVMYLAGDARWVTYRSAKVDPETGRRPSRPVNYIHEHDAGVQTFLAKRHRPGDREVSVPRKFREVEALTRLGQCLGFCFEADGEQIAEGCAPLPELYTTPDGRCLLVIQSRKTVLAMMWGGALGVFARGIDG